MKRILWIDVAKGVGISLVALSHVLGNLEPGNAVTWFLFLFHMPLFFILSGLLQAKPPSARAFASGKVRSLLLPYAAFLVVLATPTIARAILSGQSELPGLLFQVLYGGELLTGNLGVFWFVTCLFFAQLIMAGVLLAFPSPRSPGAVATVLTMTLVGSVVTLLGPTPLAIGVAPFAVFFIWVGVVLREIEPTIRLRTALIATLAAAATLIILAVAQVPHKLDMKFAAYGVPVVGALLR